MKDAMHNMYLRTDERLLQLVGEASAVPDAKSQHYAASTSVTFSFRFKNFHLFDI